MSFSIIHRLDLVEISGKRNRKVPIMLTKETRKAIELLIICRPSTIPSENNYVFACTTRASTQHILGWDWVFENVKEIQACLKQPAAIMGTKLRKYIATVSQTAALSAQDLDWLARHLGHNVSIHRVLQTAWRDNRADQSQQVTACSRFGKFRQNDRQKSNWHDRWRY